MNLAEILRRTSELTDKYIHKMVILGDIAIKNGADPDYIHWLMVEASKGEIDNLLLEVLEIPPPEPIVYKPTRGELMAAFEETEIAHFFDYFPGLRGLSAFRVAFVDGKINGTLFEVDRVVQGKYELPQIGDKMREVLGAALVEYRVSNGHVLDK